jgi:predicted DNA-binding protein with PD1-like motif
MKSDIENNYIVAKLADGENLFGEIEKIVAKYGIRSGIIVCGIGMLKDFEIGFFNGSEYKKEHVTEPHELIALHGSIAFEKKKLVTHLHCGVARCDHSLIGGHLFSATVAVLNELTILKLEEIKMSRKMNRKSGLVELEINSD